MSRGKSLACFLSHSNSLKLDFLLLRSVRIISGLPPPTPRVNSVMQKKCHLWKAINTITAHRQTEQRAEECRKAVNSDQVLPCSLPRSALQAAGVSFPAPPGDLCPPQFLLLYSNWFFLGGAVNFTHSLSMHWHPLPKLTLPSSNLSFQAPFLNRATWLNSCRGLKCLWGSQEIFSHLTLLWWQGLDISVIFKRCSLSASLTFCLVKPPQAQLDQRSSP